jgi:hypothetical protein
MIGIWQDMICIVIYSIVPFVEIKYPCLECMVLET